MIQKMSSLHLVVVVVEVEVEVEEVVVDSMVVEVDSMVEVVVDSMVVVKEVYIMVEVIVTFLHTRVTKEQTTTPQPILTILTQMPWRVANRGRLEMS